jgi:hypothetical protein
MDYRVDKSMISKKEFIDLMTQHGDTKRKKYIFDWFL